MEAWMRFSDSNEREYLRIRRFVSINIQQVWKRGVVLLMFLPAGNKTKQFSELKRLVLTLNKRWTRSSGTGMYLKVM